MLKEKKHTLNLKHNYSLTKFYCGKNLSSVHISVFQISVLSVNMLWLPITETLFLNGLIRNFRARSGLGGFVCFG